MPTPEFDSKPGSHRLLGSAFLASVLIAVTFITFSWGRLLLIGASTDGVGEIVLGVVTGWTVATVAYVPFLFAVLIVVADSSRRAVTGGAVLVYVLGLLLTVGQTFLPDFPRGIELTVLAVPLARVVTFLGVATAVWLAYHGGYERLVPAAENANSHPLLANVVVEDIGPALSLRRGLVSTGVAAIVGAGGLVLVHGIGNFLRGVARSGAGGSSVRVLFPGQVWRVGVPLTRLPLEWLFTASFLLAVLFVTGPRLGSRDLLKGIAVVFGVQSTVILRPALVPPFRPVDIWAASGPVLAPLGDAIRLFGIAVAVWLTFHGGLETLQSLIRSKPVSD